MKDTIKIESKMFNEKITVEFDKKALKSDRITFILSKNPKGSISMKSFIKMRIIEIYYNYLTTLKEKYESNCAIKTDD